MPIPRMRPFTVIAKSGAHGILKDGDPHAQEIRATVKDYGNANPLAVVLVDTSGTAYVAGSPVSPGTPAQSTVADSAVNVTLLAANANRLGATIANDSSAILYLKLGATATTASYTVRMVQFAYYEVPYGYTGIIDGIWASDPGDGAARITELTA